MTDTLPQTDMIFTRDCLVHYSYDLIYKTINNIKKNRSLYFATATFPDKHKNIDIQTGGWRKINLEKPPFNFPELIFTIYGKCIGGLSFKHKSI